MRRTTSRSTEPMGEGGDTQAPKADAVEEIKRYKELLDAGVITEAEFAAKKRLLLGI